MSFPESTSFSLTALALITAKQRHRGKQRACKTVLALRRAQTAR